MEREHGVPLAGVRVLDLSRTTAGAYCTKLLVDAGADVVKVEPPEGDPLRRWNDAGADLDVDGALFRYLCASKRSVIGEPGDVLDWAFDADLLVEDLGPGQVDVQGLRARYPQLVVMSISPFGHHGPYADRAATEFTLQALCGSMAGRGEPDRPPLQAGGRLGQWLSGSQAAMAGLAAYRRARVTGQGEHVDLSMLEVMVRIFGRAGLLERHMGAADKGRFVAIPSILPTADGWVGVFLVTRQHYNDFVTLLGRPDLEETDFWQLMVRFARRAEFLPIIHEWSTKQTTAEIISLFSEFQIPVVPMGDGESLPKFDQCVANDIFVSNPSGGFPQPRIPYKVSGVRARPFGLAPTLSDRKSTLQWEAPRLAPPSGHASQASPKEPDLPLSNIRIIDFTGYWAGPEATDLFGALGADVIKVESPFRPDPARAMSTKPEDDRWWEFGSQFHATDRNRRGIAVDLSTPAGNSIITKLIATADVVIENFRPGALDRLGLSWETIHALAPQVVLVKMPAFGLTGPWKLWGAFGPTIEQVSGMAFTTGYTEHEPLVPGGPCDPIAGVHAAFATLVALESRDETGSGAMVEVPMFETGLNVAAEIVIEYAAYGRVLRPRGNRGAAAVPQGAFQCAGVDRWAAIAVESSDQWLSLRELLQLPEQMASPELLSLAKRREVEDEIEGYVAAWCATRERDEVCRLLSELGIPAEPVTSKQAVDGNPQLRARGFLETVRHSLAGDELQPSVGFQYASHKRGWLRRAAPTLGEHNDEVLAEIGLTPKELEELYASDVIGNKWISR